MKIVFTMNLPYFPAYGGASRSNRYMLESLAARGHEVTALVPLLPVPARQPEGDVLAEIERCAAGAVYDSAEVGYVLNGVSVVAVREAGRLAARLAMEIERARPDWALVSCEDPSQVLLRTALRTRGQARVAYLARTTSFLPFGPQSFFPSPARAELLRGVDRILTVSRYVADYIGEWMGLPAEPVPLQFFGAPPFPNLGRGDRGYVTMVNPCAVKGLSIFLGLADLMPDVAFAAVPTWGMNAAEHEALRRRSNVTLLAPSEDVDDILAVTRVLLVPSLWAEAKSRVITEAMLRGVPVLASDSGGNGEAKLGTRHLLPVRLVERFDEKVDENMLPLPIVPEQDLGPWKEALAGLLADRALYEHESGAAREAATRYVESLTVAPLERLLEQAAEAERGRPLEDVTAAPPGTAAPRARKAPLTPEQLALLTLRLRERRRAGGEVEPPAGP